VKLVKESLYEKFTEGGDPIRDLGIGQKPEEKDIMRIEKIGNMRHSWKQRVAAEKMSKLITNKEKAFRRYLAAKQIGGEDWEITRIFLRRAVDLGHEIAKDILRQKWGFAPRGLHSP